eukprot:9031842-Alexandrium_andersonii.AAC.1
MCIRDRPSHWDVSHSRAQEVCAFLCWVAAWARSEGFFAELVTLLETAATAAGACHLSSDRAHDLLQEAGRLERPRAQRQRYDELLTEAAWHRAAARWRWA